VWGHEGDAIMRRREAFHCVSMFKVGVSMSNLKSFTQILSHVTNAIAGVQKDLSTMTQITLDGVAYSPAAILAILQAYAPLVTALMAAHNQLHAAVLAERAQRKQVLKILQLLAAFVTNLYGSDPNKLGDFGFSPKKVGVESAATKAASAAKGKATREAKKVALAAVTSPATPPPAAPAATAPATGSTTTKS
jgi:hypothetical protein